MKVLCFIFINLCFLTSVNAFVDFSIKTQDQKFFLTGQFDYPQISLCGMGPYKSVIFVSGTGWADRDGLSGRSGSKADYVYKYTSDYLNNNCYATVRWDYRGVSCAPTKADDVGRCINQDVRKEMDHQSMLEDIESIYNQTKNNVLIKNDEIRIVGHSEGSLNVSILVERQKIDPKGLLFIGGLTESPQSIFRWQTVERMVEYLFDLDLDGDDKVSNKEIETNFKKSKLVIFGKPDFFYAEKGYWTKSEYYQKMIEEYNLNRDSTNALNDEDPFYLSGIILAKNKYWKIWLNDSTSVLDRLVGYLGKIIYINGDIDSQTPGVREKYFLDNFNKKMKSKPIFKLINNKGHCLGAHPIGAPIDDDMVLEIFKSLEEL